MGVKVKSLAVNVYFTNQNLMRSGLLLELNFEVLQKKYNHQLTELEKYRRKIGSFVYYVYSQSFGH